MHGNATKARRGQERRATRNVERFRVGTTADKIANAIAARERNGVIDLSSYRAAKASLDEARLDQDQLSDP